jgi:sec-independent protein translocase protein TatB
MFDIGWSEMAIIAVVALLVIGPKELPAALRTFAQWSKTARKLAREFQGGMDELVRHADLDDAKKAIEAAKRGVKQQIEQAIEPATEAVNEIKSVAADSASKPTDAPSGAGVPAVTAPVEQKSPSADAAGGQAA